jgi:hypothetical protein
MRPEPNPISPINLIINNKKMTRQYHTWMEKKKKLFKDLASLCRGH